MRRLIAFPLDGETLVGTLDEAPGAVGLLIVSGGNEIRSGAHRGMALLAARVADEGFPVFRFDRRGIGDSSGENRGFEGSRNDIRSATKAFVESSAASKVVAFGNCDAATTIWLMEDEDWFGEMILANPWTIDQPSDLPPPAAVRSRYAAKLRQPREVWRLISGGVDLRLLWRGLRRVRERRPASLAAAMTMVDGECGARKLVLTARGDNTAIAFRAALPHVPVVERDTASHSFAGPGDADWLFDRIMETLRTAAAELA